MNHPQDRNRPQNNGGNLNKPDPLERELLSGNAPTPAPQDAAAAKAAAEALAAEQAKIQERAIAGKAINNPNPNSNRFEASELDIPDSGPIGLDEIRAKAHAELDSEQILAERGMTDEEIAYEAFMNEKVIVVVHESPNEEDLAVVCPMVNGVGQPIVRGYPTPVKRKYIEVLARAKETKYKQVQADANDPSSLQMIPRTVLAYPFAIERDDNPNGRAWLRDIIRQPA